MKFSFRLVAWFILATVFLCTKYYCLSILVIEAVKEFSIGMITHPWTYYVLLIGLSLAFGKVSEIFWKGMKDERKMLESKD